MKRFLIIALAAVGILAAILVPRPFMNGAETGESASAEDKPRIQHKPRWGYIVQLRPDQLQEIADKTPVVYWPLGIIEHHGWALPVGFDGLRAERECQRMVMPGHGPWSYILEEVLPPIAAAHPDVLIVGMPDPKTKPQPEPDKSGKARGSHADRVETAMGLALLPELIDMDAFEAPRDLSKVWPASGRVPKNFVTNPPVNFDEASPCFAQSGEDGRLAKAEDVEAQLAAYEDRVVKMVKKHLGR